MANSSWWKYTFWKSVRPCRIGSGHAGSAPAPMLKVADMRPEMMFVLRDQRDRNTKVQNDALTLMKELLKEAVSSSQMNFDNLVSLRRDAVFCSQVPSLSRSETVVL